MMPVAAYFTAVATYSRSPEERLVYLAIMAGVSFVAWLIKMAQDATLEREGREVWLWEERSC